jgi:hypothetical protein
MRAWRGRAPTTPQACEAFLALLYHAHYGVAEGCELAGGEFADLVGSEGMGGAEG